MVTFICKPVIFLKDEMRFIRQGIFHHTALAGVFLTSEFYMH